MDTTLASESPIGLATRYREYLFDSMSGSDNPPYRDHRWNGENLIYYTDDDFTLVVPVTLEDTHDSVSEKLHVEYDRVRQEAEYDRIEAEEIERMEMGYHFLIVF